MPETTKPVSKPVVLKDVMSYFGMTPKEMSTEWRKLTPEDKTDIIVGLSNGTETY